MKTSLILLLAEYETATPHLEDVAWKLFKDDHATVLKKAKARAYPFPVFRAGGQKSPWLVDISELSKYLEQLSKDEKANFEARRAS